MADEDYRKLALHSDLIRIATIVVKYAVAPVTTTLVADYLKKRFLKRFGESDVKASFVVEHADGKTIKLEYGGPSATFEKTMTRLIKDSSKESPGDSSGRS